MKKLVIAAALVLTFAVPMTFASTSALAQWYRVDNPGSHVDLFAERGLRGNLRCRIPHGEVLVTNDRFRSGRFVHVFWQKRFGVLEWHWKDAHNNWCPHWNRNGWVETRLLKPIQKPGGWWIN